MMRVEDPGDVSTEVQTVIVDETCSASKVAAFAQSSKALEKLLLIDIRSDNPLITTEEWDFVHKPVTTATLLDALHRPEANTPAEFSRPLQNVHVLVVDDNAVNQLLAESMLSGLGASYETVSDGLAAVAAANNQSFDLILMDCLMPNMDGFEATRELRANNISTPIIAATASASVGDFEDALASGMNDVLVKPFSALDLERILVKHLPMTREQVTELSGITSLINDEALHAIAKINPGSGVDLVDQVVALFEQQVPQFIDDIGKATRNADANETRRLVHAMKSSAMNIGAAFLGGRLAEIEAASRDAGQLLTPDELTALEQLTQESLKQLLSRYADIRKALATGS